MSDKGLVPRLPIKVAIWLFTAVVLLGGWAAVEYQIGRELKEAERIAIEQVENRAATFEQYATRTFEAADMVTRHLGDHYMPTVASLAAKGGKPLVITDAIIDRRLFAGVHVVSPEGHLVASTLEVDHPVDVSDHPVFAAQSRQERDGLQISPPLPSAFIPGRYVHMSRRFSNRNGETVGYVDVQIRPEQLSNFLKDAPFSSTDLISVIGLDGITLARREGSRVTSGEDLGGRLVMRMQQRSPNGTYVGPSSLDGHVRYFAHRRLNDYPAFVTAGVSRSETIAPVAFRAHIYYAAMVVLTIATLLITLLIFSTFEARQRRAEALAEANRRLRNAQRVAKIGDWEYDLRSGKVHWSDQLFEMYERKPDNRPLSMDDFQAYLAEEDRKNVQTVLEAAINTGEPQAYEFRAHLPSGAISDRHVIAVPTVDDSGMVVKLHGTDQDVSHDKLLRNMEEQVAHLGRVDAMNMMASTLAHELNQPLTAASNYLSGGERLLKSGNPDRTPMLAEAIEAARRQVHVAAQIIRRVRDMIGPKSGVREAASLPKVIDDSLGLLEATGACLRTSVRRELHAEAEFVWADAIQVQQVMVNLLRNACEAAGEMNMCDINIVTKPGPEGFITINVSDTGPGIKRPLEEIFSPFASEKENGLGLGLSISRTIIEYHGGRIWVEKSDASGTTIALTLPTPEAAEEAA